MPANLENTAVFSRPQDWKTSVFIPIPKKVTAKECSNYCAIALISHTSRVCSKFSKPGFNSKETVTFQMLKVVLEKAEEPEIKCPTSTGSQKKQESSRKTSTSALLTMPKAFVWITTNWKILKEMGISDHLTCLLRNLHADQEAAVRTGHRKKGWFQIRKGVHQGCILSPYLFNLYAEYIMVWMKHKLESRLLGGTSITSDMQMTPPLWQKAKKN